MDPGSIVSVHGANGWVFTAPNGVREYPAYLIVLSLAQGLLGDGACALSPSIPLLCPEPRVSGTAIG